jgi:CDP-diacylglycerol--glycerol-3-phosphate 3-phosphatidyltransferase
MNLPNALTMARMLVIPVFIVFLMTGHPYIAGVIFIAASCTDFLDGHIARRRGVTTDFGKLMDPLADKVLTCSAFVCLVWQHDVPAWMVIVILAREFTITGLRSVAASSGRVIAADLSGKLKTIFQMTAVSLLLIRNWPFSYIGVPVDRILLWAAVALTVYSGAEYLIKNRYVFNMDEKPMNEKPEDV